MTLLPRRDALDPYPSIHGLLRGIQSPAPVQHELILNTTAPRVSPSPDSSHAASDAEAARQLITEAHFADTHPPSPALLLGANLLNAARAHASQNQGSSMRGTMRKNGAGKLKRVSVVPEGPKQNLARRGDLYEIELSPEKGHYALPEKVNQKPLKIRRKKPVAEERSVAPGLSSDLPTHHVQRSHLGQGDVAEHVPSTDPGIRSSPPQIAPAQSDIIDVTGTGNETSPVEAEARPTAPEHVQIEETLDNGKPRCTVVYYKYDKKAGPHHQQCRRPATDRTDDGPTCSIHISRIPAVQCGEMVVSEGVSSQCYRTATSHNANGARCAVHENQQATPRGKRKTASHHVDDEPASSARDDAHPPNSQERRRTRTSAPVQPLAKTLTKRRKTAGDTPANNTPVDDTPVDDTPVEPIQQLPARTRKSVDRPKNVQELVEAPAESSEDEQSEYEPDADEGAHSTAQDEEARPTADFPEGLDTVFKFLDLKERPETCQTKTGTAIKRLCNTSCVHFGDKTISMDTVVEDATDIQVTLKLVTSKIRKKHQLAFKSDAYGHLFRSLTLYLRALYVWLLDTHGAVTESLEAMRVVAPFMCEMLAFKDTIAQWNVAVPQQRKGDRIIKDVDSLLIAPLRQVSKSFNVRLSKLEEVLQRHKEQAALERKMKEAWDTENARIEAAKAIEARKKRWQNLHIVRMQCEPDVYKRRNLFHTSFEDVVERDANGVVFERLPVFRPRSTPPHSQMSESADEVEWSEAEETALLEGLQEFAGKPGNFRVTMSQSVANRQFRPKCL